MLAMVAEKHEVKNIFSILLSENGTEFTLQSPSKYLPTLEEEVSFLCLMKRAQTFGEIACGYQYMQEDVCVTEMNPKDKYSKWKWNNTMIITLVNPNTNSPTRLKSPLKRPINTSISKGIANKLSSSEQALAMRRTIRCSKRVANTTSRFFPTAQDTAPATANFHGSQVADQSIDIIARAAASKFEEGRRRPSRSKPNFESSMLLHEQVDAMKDQIDEMKHMIYELLMSTQRSKLHT